VQPALPRALSLLSLIVAAPAWAQEPPAESAPLIGPPVAGGLTADEVARRAVDTSREVRARAEERAAADATVRQAQSGYVPRLSGVARYTRLSELEQPILGNIVVAPSGTTGPVTPGTPLVSIPLTFPLLVNQYATQATLQVPLSDYVWRLPKLTGAAKGNARAAALLEEAARLRGAADAQVSYYAWARARLQTVVAERAVAQARAHLKDVSAASATGTASKADVLRVESQVASNELLLTRARAATNVLEARLRTIMHDESGRPYEVGEDLRVITGGIAQRAEREQVAGALQKRLEPRALSETAAATRAQASAARAAGMPRLDAVGSATYANPNGRIFPQKDEFRGTWDATVQLSWAPTDLFGTEAAHDTAAARARQIEAERAAVADGITLEVAQSREELAQAETALHTSERGLAAAEESYRVRRALFQAGRSTSVELTDAETERSRAQLEAISARIDHRIAQVRLAHAAGDDVRK
jgi:outer membrane protein TolC